MRFFFGGVRQVSRRHLESIKGIHNIFLTLLNVSVM